MAKRERVRKTTQEEVPTSQKLSDIEQADAMRASAKAETTGKDGETTSNRLPYMPRTKDGQEAYEALGQSIPGFLWVERARALGHSLTAEEVREIVAFDGNEVTCTAPSGQCSYRFQPVRIAQIQDDGTLRSDERLVSGSNPNGVSYRGAYLAVPVDPKNQHSKLRVLGPLCRRDQQALSATYKAAGWHVRSLDLAGAETFVVAVNTARDAGRAAWLARKDENARALGLVTEDGEVVERGGGRNRGGFNSPHRATNGHQGRQRDRQRERGISNRG